MHEHGRSTAPHGAGAATGSLPREMVLASAGAGKTFRISSRIIGLLAYGAAPDAILASTFTRKAAGEILSRVLIRLAEAALDPEKSRELAMHAALDDASRTLEPERCLEILTGLTRGLHRLNVGTLDAFFIRAAQTFAHELRLPPGWGIADEPTSRRVRADALQEVLRQADPGTTVELVRLASRGRAARSVQDSLLRQLDTLHDIYHQLDPAASEPWSLYPGLREDGSDGVRAGGDSVRAGESGVRDDERGVREVERGDTRAGEAGGSPAGEAGPGGAQPPHGAAERARLAEAVEAIAPPLTSKGTPHRSWEKALATAARAIREGDWEALVAKGICAKILDGEPSFSGVVIPEEAHDVFAEAIETACRVIGGRLSAQLGAMGRLVSLFDEAYARLRYREGAYRFDDVTRLLGGAASLGARPDLHYRLDARLRHLLLDEFQDTSVPQWSALEPLVDAQLRVADGDRAGGGDRAAVVVADPKQSIYGWRGANPELVYAVGDRYGLERGVLARSWRSSQVVLDAVNAVFDGIEASPVLDDADQDVAAGWARAFTPHEAARALPGHVRVVVGPEDAGRSSHRPNLLAFAAETVRDLHARAPGFGIGVLTRENRAVARLIHELRRLGVEASEEGGNPLTDSPAVASVLALLELADHPDDRLAGYHVARTPVGRAVGYDDPGDAAGARRLAHRFRERLLRDGYGATLNDLAGGLLDACGARDARRVMQLVELGFRYDARATLRPTDFVRLVETERVEDPTAAPVRVMTIHQSKGLEFDIVVLPELDAQIYRGGGAAALPYRDSPTGPVTRVFPYVSGAIRRLFPEIEEASRQHRGAVLRDALSMLYVAMTRARYALHVVVKPDAEGKPSQARTPAMIVREALCPGRIASPGDAAFYEAGDPHWYERAAPSEPARMAASAGSASAGAGSAAASAASAAAGARLAPAPVRLRDAGARRRRMLPRRSPSQLEGGAIVDLRQRMRLDVGGSLERGTLVHAWCQEVAWIDDGEPEAARLRRIARRLTPRLVEADVDALIARFRDWLARPDIRAALRRDAYPAGARVERELAFIQRSADAIVEGVIDRLVVWEREGSVHGAAILDYKTDAVTAGDGAELARRVEYYRPQLAAYRGAVAGLYRLDPERIDARLLFLRAGVVVEV